MCRAKLKPPCSCALSDRPFQKPCSPLFPLLILLGCHRPGQAVHSRRGNQLGITDFLQVGGDLCPDGLINPGLNTASPIVRGHCPDPQQPDVGVDVDGSVWVSCWRREGAFAVGNAPHRSHLEQVDNRVNDLGGELEKLALAAGQR